jgi:hypothetical protein
VSLKLLEYERETLDELILRDPKPIQDYVDVSSLRAAYKRYSAAPLQSSEEAFSIMLATTLGLWLRSMRLVPSKPA